MTIFCPDFETFYDPARKYSLRNMTTQEYILDHRYETIILAMVEGDPVTGRVTNSYVIDGWQVRQWVEERRAELEASAAIAHNGLFDPSILTWHYGLRAGMWVDTLAMARYLIKPHTGKASLASMSEHLGLPAKGGYVTNMAGRRRADLTPGEYSAYCDYSLRDALNAWEGFLAMRDAFPPDEFWLVDRITRMMTEPKFRLNLNLLRSELERVRADKRRLLAECGLITEGASAELSLAAKKRLASPIQFADLLLSLGVTPPTKVSEKQTANSVTGEPVEIYAFAKTDEAMIELQEHPDERVQALIAAKLGNSSTLMESRLSRFIACGALKWPDTVAAYPAAPQGGETGVFAVPLNYGAAHTNRLGGADNLNCQNLPYGPLRIALEAPEGYVVLSADQSQVEARIAAGLAGCTNLLEVFRQGLDPYCTFGTSFYGRVITKADERERQASKVSMLSLQFGVGWVSLQSRAAHDPVVKNRVILTDREAREIVQHYRAIYHQIEDSWEFCLKSLLATANNGSMIEFGPVTFMSNQVLLPNDTRIPYPDLQRSGSELTASAGGNRRRYLYGAKIFQNIVQALARVSVFQAAKRAYDRFPDYFIALTVHDDLIYLVLEQYAEHARAVILEELRRPLDWLPNIRLDAEAGYAKAYGLIKKTA